MQYEKSLEFAFKMDQEDSLKGYRDKFFFPQKYGKDVIYFCGNSLGLQPKTVPEYIEQELKDWKELGVHAHYKAKNPWYYYHNFFSEQAARLVGAKPGEVVMMNSLTANIHFMMVSFYRPVGNKFKIIAETGAFPSDQYAMQSQARFHGFDPDEALIELKPRTGEYNLRTEDILETINNHKDELALIMIGGVNYYTGQAFDMEAITKAGHEVEAYVGFDLAHAAGNLKLSLHDWNVDFAVWCTYKYLNSGPGAVGGAFVHEIHGDNSDIPRFEGWWGHNEEERFQMKKGFKPMKGAAAWQLSNAPVFPMAVHKAALDIFDEAGMDKLCQKRDSLTGYMEYLIQEISIEKNSEVLKIITPKNKLERGCQISMIVKEHGKQLHDYITSNGIVADWREPEVLRVAPVPLYNSFEDVYHFYETIRNYFKNN